MDIRFIAQPQENAQLGALLTDSLSNSIGIKGVTIVSAFASMATVIRIKSLLLNLPKSEKLKVRLVIGVDMGGTSKEVLTELASWPFEVFIFKNKKGGVTFHPKIYVVERESSAEIYIGSNNLTEGGFFKNYEGSAFVRYHFPKDKSGYEVAKEELQKFLDPKPPVAKLLDGDFLKKLLNRNDIPSDAETRVRAKTARVGASSVGTDDTFGFESTPGAKALPVEYQAIVLAANDNQLKEIKKANKSRSKTKKVDAKGSKKTEDKNISLLDIEPMASMPAGAFYMELNATKGAQAEAGGKRNIPGEQRIPLPAIWSAQDFWGWKANYQKDVNPRKGKAAIEKVSSKPSEDRVYYNWYATWALSQIGDPSRNVANKTVRMYFYENSSDFRFTCGEIAKWGEPGDILKIERSNDGETDYKCQLAKKGTPEHAKWSTYCAVPSGSHSKRGFGFS